MKLVRLSSWLILTTVFSSLLSSPMNIALAQSQASTSGSAAVVKPVSINKAGSEDLQTIRGIGPALAERIMSYRQANGGFKALEQLKEVKGVGDAKFEKMKDQITL